MVISGLVFLVLIAMCSYIGVKLATFPRWNQRAVKVGVPFFVGIGLGPFIFSFVGALGLLLFPGHDYRIHVAIAFFVLSSLSILCALLLPRKFLFKANNISKTFVFLFMVSFLILLSNALILPLMQNDSLEYLTVAKVLFAKGSYWAYPVIYQEGNESGFYGPWTHPPLYVIGIYLAQAVQGTSEIPGLMRLISPWFAGCGCLLVWSMGRMINPLTGALAALILLSTPLFFLGSDSGLIDSLPILGLSLSLAMSCAVTSGKISSSAFLGLAIGLSFWTHSQAILFLPIVLGASFLLNFKTQRMGPSILQALVTVMSCLSIGIWPYLRNYNLYGSFISDSPEVVSLVIQNWPEYFTFDRGLNTIQAVIQYGIFKGWFAVESFGASFWLMSVGVFAVLISIFKRKRIDFLVSNSLIMIGIYLTGVTLSCILGMELMIKNDRYTLVIIPLVSIVGAYGLAEIFGRIQKYSDNVYKTILIIFASVFLSSSFLFSKYRFNKAALPFWTSADAGAFLRSVGAFKAMGFLKEGSYNLTLSLQPADMYYSATKMIGFLDPRLVPMYQAKEPKAALSELKKLGVVALHIPPYSSPPLYNSQLEALLGEVDLVQLAFYSQGTQIYLLNKSNLAEISEHRLQRNQFSWSRYFGPNIGGPKAVNFLGMPAQPWNVDNISDSTGKWFNKNWSTYVRAEAYLDVPDVVEIKVETNIEGYGYVRVWYETNVDGTSQKDFIGNIVLGSLEARRKFIRRIPVSTSTRNISFTFEHVGFSNIKIREFTVTPFRSIPGGE